MGKIIKYSLWDLREEKKAFEERRMEINRNLKFLLGKWPKRIKRLYNGYSVQ
jgi:hypothetical protein